LLYLWENGHCNHITDRYVKRTDKCSTHQVRSSRQSPLKISNFSSAFLFLFIGLSLSFLVFVLENIKCIKGRGTVSKSANTRTIPVEIWNRKTPTGANQTTETQCHQKAAPGTSHLLAEDANLATESISAARKNIFSSASLI
jgi:hypothetical protein